jgi:hypothetical protein
VGDLLKPAVIYGQWIFNTYMLLIMKKLSTSIRALSMLAAFTLPYGALADSWTLKRIDRFSFPEGGYRSQGAASDGKQWYFSWRYGLERSTPNYRVQAKNFLCIPIKAVFRQILLRLVEITLETLIITIKKFTCRSKTILITSIHLLPFTMQTL